MTLTKAISLARRKARTTEFQASDSDVVDALNEGQKQFAKDGYGLIKEDYIALTPVFDTRTNFAIRVTITGGTNALAATDVAITGTNRDDTTGTIVAADLQGALRTAIGVGANLTVVWSTTAWTFTIDTIDGTRIQLTSPSGITYVDAMGLLFNVSTVDETEATASYTSGIPEDVAVEADLPSDYLQMSGPVEWNGTPLKPAPFDVFASPGGASSTPLYYGVRGKKIRLSPSPNEQGMLHLWYEYLPTSFAAGYQECGLSGRQLDTATGLSATTAYSIKVNIDAGGVVEYNITTAADLTFDAVIDLLNAQLTYAEFSLVEGDLRCSSTTLGGSSAIALSAGTTNTDLFATLTGWSAFDTAVAGTGGLNINIDDEYAMAVVHYAAFMLVEDQWEDKVADRQFSLYTKIVNDFTLKKANANTAIFPRPPSRREPLVTV
jgi:hypothetical protein